MKTTRKENLCSGHPFQISFHRAATANWENARLPFQKLFPFFGLDSFDVSLTELVRVGKCKGMDR